VTPELEYQQLDDGAWVAIEWGETGLAPLNVYFGATRAELDRFLATEVSE
jgi:hypothetical protein